MLLYSLYRYQYMHCIHCLWFEAVVHYLDFVVPCVLVRMSMIWEILGNEAFVCTVPSLVFRLHAVRGECVQLCVVSWNTLDWSAGRRRGNAGGYVGISFLESHFGDAHGLYLLLSLMAPCTFHITLIYTIPASQIHIKEAAYVFS